MKYLIPALVVLSFSVQSQDHQQRYLNGKELFRSGSYNLAMETFAPLTEQGNQFEEYASFYYALAAYHSDQKYIAKDMLSQIESRNSTWRKTAELYLWQAQIHFDLKDYGKAIEYIGRIRSEDIFEVGQQMKLNELAEVTGLDTLKTLHERFPRDAEIAEAIVMKIAAQSLAEKELGLMEKLVNEFDLDKNKYKVADYSSNTKKELYEVAVLLPFMHNGIDDTRNILRNSLVTSLYEGMLLANQDLIQQGIKINLNSYDTKRTETQTNKVLAMPELKSVDLIIGPLYPGPSQVVTQFSFDNQINMVNPLSSNAEVIGNNPYSFLFKSTTETQAIKAAQFARANFTNKTAVIVYEQNERDSVFAHIYKQELEKDSFNIIWFKGLNESNARMMIDTLAAKYERDIPGGDELDSLQEVDGYPLKVRRKERPNDPDEYYEELLVIAPDSIGHVITVSNKVLYTANAISAITIRGDRIPLIGKEEWLSYSSTNFDQLEQLGTFLIAPSFYNESSQEYGQLAQRILKTYKQSPNQYHVIGYELMLSIGKLLHENGKYFQVGVRDGQIITGRLMEGLMYGNNNDNQIVPIIKFRESELVRVDEELQSEN
ncbi:MAG: ABC transporter substrate-binding protein [Cyclobacteriaceae bacterium]